VTVVNGLNLRRDFDGGRALLDDTALAPTSTAALFRTQITVASMLLVSRADQLGRPKAAAMLAVLQRINPRALFVTMAYGRVAPEHRMGSDSWRRRHGTRGRALDAPRHDDQARFDLGGSTLRDVRPFHPQRLYTLFSEGLPLGIHRSKGWLRMASRPLDVLIWNLAGSHIALERSATWNAEILQDPESGLLPEEQRGLEAQLRTMHPAFGDRHCERTFIGHGHDRARVVAALQACLCTVDEVAAWQRGAPFADPWPTTRRRV
jgi:G3E family GTPase